MKTLKAAIDFGTNTARLLICKVKKNGELGEVLHLEREIVRMGGGFTREHGLSPEAIDRGVACLSNFSESLKKYPEASLVAVATSAVRDAVNKNYFLNLVFDKTGIALNVIDGIREAKITMQGVLAGLDVNYSSFMLFDVGGGSTEYGVMTNEKIIFTKSLPVGVVRLTEGKESPEAMLEKIQRELADLQLEMTKQDVSWDCEMLVGTAGTATTLAAISMEMADYDYRMVNNAMLDYSEIRRIYNILKPLSLADRLKIPGLEKGREDLIIAGTLITLNTMEMFGYDRLKVSDYGLLEGLIVAGIS